MPKDPSNQPAAGAPARRYTGRQIATAIGTAVACLAGAAWAVADAMNYTLPPWAKTLLITLGGGQ